MNIKSLGYRTDLIFPAFDGQVIDRGEYLVIRSPANPSFYWGNFLLFLKPPQRDDYQKWRALFAREIGSPPEVEHQVFGWDSPEGEEGEVQTFLQAGFRLIHSVVMTGPDLHSPSRPSDVVSIRALKSESDWGEAVENQVVCREPEFDETEYRIFRRRQMDRYRKMAESGLGDWFGAFIDQQLVADLGIFHEGSLGRYQSVQTHPDFRRQGIAGTLIVAAGRQAMADYDLHMLVIVTDPDSGPERLYQSLGFRPVEKQVGLERWPQMGSLANGDA
ncbi:MAG: GNAT family N-acetyltransferase [Anaerolineales bacterium]|jgi:GNAT superfamily N-acetyltransferase